MHDTARVQVRNRAAHDTQGLARFPFRVRARRNELVKQLASREILHDYNPLSWCLAHIQHRVDPAVRVHGPLQLHFSSQLALARLCLREEFQRHGLASGCDMPQAHAAETSGADDAVDGVRRRKRFQAVELATATAATK